MNEVFDVAIVGAGPAGISAACILADAKVKTVVIERGEYPGAKNMSGGVLYGHNLAQILPDFAKLNPPIERNIIESRIWYLSADGGMSISYRDKAFAGDKKYNVFTVGRAKFDRWFAAQASKKGALVIPGTVVEDFIRKDNAIVGVKTGRQDGDIYAKVVILADGVNSPLAPKTGFRPDLKAEHVALAVKEAIELTPDIIDQRFGVSEGNGITTEIMGDILGGMDGICVLYTNKSSISIAIGANLADFRDYNLKPYELIEKFKEHPMVAPLIAGGKPVEYTAHWLAEGGFDTIPQLYGDGYLIAGDSAMLFNTLHREGNNLAMASGKMAAETILEALRMGDLSKNGLAGYGDKIKKSFIGKDMKKYRHFTDFLYENKIIFNELPKLASYGAREMLTVNGISKKEKQRLIMQDFYKKKLSKLGMIKFLWNAYRAVK